MPANVPPFAPYATVQYPTIQVYDPDGESRPMDGNEIEAMTRAGTATVCPNDEEDEAAGWHAHVFERWPVAPEAHHHG